jgi:hypothetical protein
MQPPAIGAPSSCGVAVLRAVQMMMTASECRQQATLYMDEATIEERAGVRATLLGLNRSWTAIANEIERLSELRNGHV